MTIRTQVTCDGCNKRIHDTQELLTLTDSTLSPLFHDDELHFHGKLCLQRWVTPAPNRCAHYAAFDEHDRAAIINSAAHMFGVPEDAIELTPSACGIPGHYDVRVK